MRQKQIISPEQLLLDRPEYRFKPSFSRIFSFCTAVSIIYFFFVHEFSSSEKISNVYYDRIFWVSSSILLIIIIVSFLITCLLVRVFGIAIGLAGITTAMHSDYRKNLSWQDIKVVKQYKLFGLRYLSIQFLNGKGKDAIVLSYIYNLSQILDRVREYTGEDHPLTIALEREVSLPRQNPAKGL